MMSRNVLIRRISAAILSFVLPVVAAAQESSRLKILVIEGENATHNIRRKAVSPTLVEVRDERNKPVSGATVKFALPERGPGGAFAGGEHVFVASTDRSGQAALPGFVPNEQEGPFSVAVLASYSGRQGETFINQQNAFIGQKTVVAAPPEVPRRTGSGKKLLLVLALGGAAAAVGIVAVGARGGGAGTSAPPTTVGGGGVTVGGPR